MKIVLITLMKIVLITLFVILVVGICIWTTNIMEREKCVELTEILDVVFDKGGIIDKCYIIENETEYTINEYRKRLRNQILEVRS